MRVIRNNRGVPFGIAAAIAVLVGLFLTLSAVRQPSVGSQGVEAEQRMAMQNALASVARGDDRQPAGLITDRSDPRRAELDRLTRLFTERAEERGESLEYRMLGGVLLERARLDAALSDYRQAADAFAASLRLDPVNADGLLGLGQASLGLHDFNTAQESAEQLSVVDPWNASATALALDAALALGSIDEATSAFEQLDRSVQDDPAVLVRLAELERRRSGLGRARELAAEAFALAEGRGFADDKLAFYETLAGRLAFDDGDFEEATDLLEQAVAHQPDNQGSLGELARVRAATGHTDAAIELLEQANRLQPEPDHLILQGDLRTRAGDEGAAAVDYDAAVALATRDDDHRRVWARTLATYWLDHDGDIDAALEIADDELALRSDARAWDLSAWAHYRSGNLVEARVAMDQAIESAVPDATVWYHAGVISAAEGEAERAVTELTNALDLNPAFDPLLADDARTLLAEQQELN